MVACTRYNLFCHRQTLRGAEHQSGTFAFHTFIDGTGVDGVGWSARVSSSAYVDVIGILLANWSVLLFQPLLTQRVRCERAYDGIDA